MGLGLDKSVLSNSIKTNIKSISAGGGKTVGELIADADLTNFCNAIASAVIDHFTNYAKVIVNMSNHVHISAAPGSPTGTPLPGATETGSIS